MEPKKLHSIELKMENGIATVFKIKGINLLIKSITLERPFLKRFSMRDQERGDRHSAPLHNQVYRKRCHVCGIVDSAESVWKKLLLLAEADQNP